MTDSRQTPKLMNARTFLRGGWINTQEPVQVISGTEVRGTWYPAGTEVEAVPVPRTSIPQEVIRPSAMTASSASAATVSVGPIPQDPPKAKVRTHDVLSKIAKQG